MWSISVTTSAASPRFLNPNDSKSFWNDGAAPSTVPALSSTGISASTSFVDGLIALALVPIVYDLGLLDDIAIVHTEAIGALTTAVGELETNVGYLDTKTQFQSSNLLLNRTTFESRMYLDNDVNIQGNLNTYGTSNLQGVNVQGDIRAQSKIYSTQGIESYSDIKAVQSLNNKNIVLTTNTSGFSSINLKASTSGVQNRDCGIDCSPALINFTSNDLGTMSLRGGIINIGNADQTSIINLNGYINGLSLSNGFFNQFG